MAAFKKLLPVVIIGFCGVYFLTSCSKSHTQPTPPQGPPVTVSTFAGSHTAGSADGAATDASFNAPTDLAIDAQGNIFVVDEGNELIRKITPAGVVSTFAGSGATATVDGTGTAASFDIPRGIAIDGNGNLYVTEVFGNRIRKISPAGVVTTFAGSGASGGTDGTGTAASFNSPGGIAIDAGGDLFVADHNKIRKITPNGVVTTLAGTGANGFNNGDGTVATFFKDIGVAVDAQGNVYVADTGNDQVRKVTSAGLVTTFAGNGTSGAANGAFNVASFSSLSGVAIDMQGDLYLSDGNRIRRITASGTVATLAGTTAAGSTDGMGTDAEFESPSGIVVSKDGSLYVADTFSNVIRKITFQ